MIAARMRQTSLRSALFASILALVPAAARPQSSAFDESWPNILRLPALATNPDEVSSTSIWRSNDGRIQLGFRQDGGLVLGGTTAPFPEMLALDSISHGRDFIVRAPLPSDLTLDLSAGLDLRSPVSCRALLGASICPDTSWDGLGHRSRIRASIVGHGWSVGLSYAESRGDDLSFPPGAWLPSSWHPSTGSSEDWHGQEVGLISRFGNAHGNQFVIDLNLAQWREGLEPAPYGNDLQAATLSFGLFRGPLGGEIVSRLVSESAMGEPHQWSGLDVELSWRMPWHGQLQFGARNLVTRRTSRSTGDSGLPPLLEESRARTPYVRYHQDF